MIIAGAGGAAHLPGMTASLTPLPVIGVPVPLEQLDGLDSLLSIVQMPNGIPVATVGVGKARNAALLAVRILGAHDDGLRARMEEFQAGLAETVLEKDAKLRSVATRVSRGGSSGARFSTNAARPSAASAVDDAATIASASRARCVSSVSSRLVCTSRFAAASAPRGPLGEPDGERLRLGVHVVVGHDLGDETPVECLVGAEHAVRERELERAADADEARHEPARRAVGGEPDARVRHHELRGLPRDDEVGRADEAEPRACRAAVDRGDHRRVAPHEQGDRGVQRRDQPADVGRELVAERRRTPSRHRRRRTAGRCPTGAPRGPGRRG